MTDLLDLHAAELRAQGYTIVRRAVTPALATALSADLDPRFAAIDALRPDQAEALRAHVAEQHAARAGLIGG